MNSRLACIIVSLSAIRGPLNQQATSVLGNTQFQRNGSVDIRLAQELPSGYTGVTAFTQGPNSSTASLTPSFTDVMKQFSTRADMFMNNTECGDPGEGE